MLTVENPKKSSTSKIISNSVILTACVGVLAFATWLGYHYCRSRQRIIETYPHHPYYQGSTLLSTNLDYSERHDLTKEKKVCSLLILKGLTRINKLGLLSSWLKLKGYPNVQEAIEPIFKEQQKGCCYGYSLALLRLMDKEYKTPSQKLLEKLQFEHIYNFQFLQEVIHDYLKEPDSRNDLWKVTFPTGIPTDFPFSITYLFLCLCKEYKDMNLLFHEWNYTEMTTNPNELKEVFQKEYVKFEEIRKKPEAAAFANHFTIAGKINLQENEEKRALPGSHYGHTLFFQLTDRLRFHDSGSQLTGFFEFSTEEEFFDSLFKHVQAWPQYKDGYLQFTMFVIPKHQAEVRLSISETHNKILEVESV